MAPPDYDAEGAKAALKAMGGKILFEKVRPLGRRVHRSATPPPPRSPLDAWIRRCLPPHVCRRCSHPAMPTARGAWSSPRRAAC